MVGEGGGTAVDAPPRAEIDFPTNQVALRIQAASRTFVLFHSLQRHHYNFLNFEGGGPQPMNSIAWHDLALPELQANDATRIGEAVQAKLRQIRRQPQPESGLI